MNQAMGGSIFILLCMSNIDAQKISSKTVHRCKNMVAGLSLT